MKRNKLFALIITGGISVLLTSCCCAPPDNFALAVPLRAQETNMWCWAASGEMCMEFIGASIDQCDEANKYRGYSNCCNDPVPTDCVNGGWPEFEKYGYKSDVTSNTALSFTEIQNQIYCEHVPVAFSWKWLGDGGHMMVATGYQVVDGTQYININDPWAPDVGEVKLISYSEYVSGSGYSHWKDYYNIEKQ